MDIFKPILDALPQIPMAKKLFAKGGKIFKAGDMWSESFDYDGMLKFGQTITENTSPSVLRKYFESLQDVNYHTLAAPLWDLLESTDSNAKYQISKFKKELKKSGYAKGGKMASGGEIEECCESGLHLTDVDDDGFCNYCGHQEPCGNGEDYAKGGSMASGGEIRYFDRHAEMSEKTMDKIRNLVHFPILDSYSEEKFKRLKKKLEKENVSTYSTSNYLYGLYDGFDYSQTKHFKEDWAKIKKVDADYYNQVMKIYDEVAKYKPTKEGNRGIHAKGGKVKKMASGASVRYSSKRKGPSNSATWYSPGETQIGNDGNYWKIAQNVNGVNRWVKMAKGGKILKNETFSKYLVGKTIDVPRIGKVTIKTVKLNKAYGNPSDGQYNLNVWFDKKVTLQHTAYAYSPEVAYQLNDYLPSGMRSETSESGLQGDVSVKPDKHANFDIYTQATMAKGGEIKTPLGEYDYAHIKHYTISGNGTYEFAQDGEKGDSFLVEVYPNDYDELSKENAWSSHIIEDELKRIIFDENLGEVADFDELHDIKLEVVMNDGTFFDLDDLIIEDYAKGGLTEKQKEGLRKVGVSEPDIKSADERERKGSMYAQTPVNPFFNTYEDGGEVDSYLDKTYSEKLKTKNHLSYEEYDEMIDEIRTAFKINSDEAHDLADNYLDKYAVQVYAKGGKIYALTTRLKEYNWRVPMEYAQANVIRDIFLENKGRVDKKKWDDTIKKNLGWKKEWQDFKKGMEVEVKDGKYVNPYQTHLFADGGKTQGYNARLDESLGSRTGKGKSQSYKSRRDESKGTEKSMGKRPYSSVGTMDSLHSIIEKLSKELGYPNRKLSATEYEDVLKKAHKIKYKM